MSIHLASGMSCLSTHSTDWEHVLCDAHSEMTQIVHSYLSTSDLLKNVNLLSKSNKKIVDRTPRCLAARQFYKSYVNTFHNLKKTTINNIKVLVSGHMSLSKRRVLVAGRSISAPTQVRCVAYTRRGKRLCKNSCLIEIFKCVNIYDEEVQEAYLPPMTNSYGYLCHHHR